VAEHVVAEVRGDLDALMATMVAEPTYLFAGATSSIGPVGGAAVRAHYAAMIASGKNRLDFVIERVVADADAVVTEGRFRFAYPGSALAGQAELTARTEAGEPIRDGNWYLIDYKCVVVWPFVGGLLTGEELYVGERPRVRRALADGEYPGLGPVVRRNGDTSMWPVR
jgi:hypothetical protein